MVTDLQGLEYLHHDCDPPITHRDIKSNNILLDSDYQAHVADFGLAKVLEYTTGDLESMSHVAGSHGYIAPGLSSEHSSIRFDLSPPLPFRHAWISVSSHQLYNLVFPCT